MLVPTMITGGWLSGSLSTSTPVGGTCGEADGQVPLAAVGIEDLGVEARRTVGRCEGGDDLLDRGGGGGGQVEIVGGAVDQPMRLDRVAAGKRQPVGMADGQGDAQQQGVVAVNRVRHRRRPAARGTAPATRGAGGGAGAGVAIRRRAARG